MRVIRYIDLDLSFEFLFQELLLYLNSNPHINHVTLTSDTSIGFQNKLSIIAQELATRLQYSIDPAPIIVSAFDAFSSDQQSLDQQSLDENNNESCLYPTEKLSTGVDTTKNQLLFDANTFIVSIDFDGCADTHEGKQRIIDDILEFVSQALFIQRIIVIIGSLRQTLICDYFNAQKNAGCHNGKLMSCHGLGVHFVEQLRAALSDVETTRLPPTVEFDPLMMSDILNQLEVGTTYKALNKFHTKIEQGERPQQFIIESASKAKYIDLLCKSTHSRVTHAFEWVDVSKISLILTQLHHVAQKYIAAHAQKIHFRFYDDREDILTRIYTYLQEWQLVPEKITFDCAQNYHDEGIFTIPFEPIHGTGHVIPDYQALFLYFAKHLPQPALCPSLENSLISLYLSYRAEYDIAVTIKEEEKEEEKKNEPPLCYDLPLLKPIASKAHAHNFGVYTDNFFKPSVSIESKKGNTSLTKSCS